MSPSGNIQKITTSQSSNIGLLPGNGSGSNAGTDTYNYDPLARTTADSQGGPSGTTASSTLSYQDNGEIATTSGPEIHNGSYSYQGTTGQDAGKLQGISTGGIVYGFDNDGNRICQGTASPCSSHVTYTYNYDAEDRLTGWADTANDSDGYTYDGNGLLTGTSAVVYEPICPSRPIGLNTGALGHRAAAGRHDGSASPLLQRCTFVSDLTWNNALGTPTLAVDQQTAGGIDEGHTDFVMGPLGLPVEQLNVASGISVPYWYYQDPQGNTRVLMDANGSVSSTGNYPPFGEAQSFSNGAATPLQYNGTFTELWTGFVYDQARWYDPSTGQFLSQDPEVDQTLQPYAFANDDPVAGVGGQGVSGQSTSAKASLLWRRIETGFIYFNHQFLLWDASRPTCNTCRSYSRKQAAAIMGNLVVESNYTLNPKIKQIGCTPTSQNQCGAGISQWTYAGGPKGSDQRWRRLQSWAGHKNYLKYGTQLQFIWYELLNPYPCGDPQKCQGDLLNNNEASILEHQTNLYWMTWSFGRNYENPNNLSGSGGHCNGCIRVRYEWAQAILKKANHQHWP